MSPEAMLPHILSTIAAIRAAKEIRDDLIVVGHVPLAKAFLANGTRSMAAVLRDDIHKDEWRFLSSLEQSSPWSAYSQGSAPGQLQQVMFEGQSATGMLWATQNDSTIVSFAFPPNWANSSVQAELHQMDETGENLNSIGVEIPNLSRPEHVQTHRELITTYGRNLAKSSLIHEGDGFVIRIWFNDHPPPHFHVMLGSDTSSSVARYSIETLDVLSGTLPPALRKKVEEWARVRRAELMNSWIRCRNGQHPFRIE
jgi:hypothetical protein